MPLTGETHGAAVNRSSSSSRATAGGHLVEDAIHVNPNQSSRFKHSIRLVVAIVGLPDADSVATVDHAGEGPLVAGAGCQFEGDGLVTLPPRSLHVILVNDEVLVGWGNLDATNHLSTLIIILEGRYSIPHTHSNDLNQSLHPR